MQNHISRNNMIKRICMRKLMLLVPFLVVSCKPNTEPLQTQIYSCEGVVTQNHAETPCLSADKKFKFNMALGEKVELDFMNCANVMFNWKEFVRTENTDLRLGYQYKYKTNKGMFVTQELNLDKVSGNFTFMGSIGSDQESLTQRTEKGIMGTCTRISKVID